MNPLDLLALCEHVYAYPGIVTPDGRDAASVDRLGSQIVLTFRGTLTFGGTIHQDAVAFRDWLNDAHDSRRWLPEYRGQVHSGFAASLERLWQLLPVFKGQVIVTGHSKGGALAQLAGLRLALLGVRVQVVTFGSPRAGDHKFADALDELAQHDRYVNPRDLVPHLPPLGYEHSGSEVNPPHWWTGPRDVIEAHSLEKGYRPWISETDGPKPARPAKAA